MDSRALLGPCAGAISRRSRSRRPSGCARAVLRRGEVRETDALVRSFACEYQRALAAGDVEAAVAAFEPDAYVREPAGGAYVHRGRDDLVALYELFFSNGGGIPLEHCAVTDDGRSCALEYNVVRWGRTELPPGAGVAVYVRGSTGKLASARIYDDADPPLSSARDPDPGIDPGVHGRDGLLGAGP